MIPSPRTRRGHRFIFLSSRALSRDDTRGNNNARSIIVMRISLSFFLSLPLLLPMTDTLVDGDAKRCIAPRVTRKIQSASVKRLDECVVSHRVRDFPSRLQSIFAIGDSVLRALIGHERAREQSIASERRSAESFIVARDVVAAQQTRDNKRESRAIRFVFIFD